LENLIENKTSSEEIKYNEEKVIYHWQKKSLLRTSLLINDWIDVRGDRNIAS